MSNDGPSRKDMSAPIDPTINVVALVASEKVHAAELRQADERRRDDLRQADLGLTVSLRAAESRRVDEVQGLHVHYAQELRVAEAQRIDAIRNVDVMAAKTADERQAALAASLAATVASTAEANRVLVASTAEANRTLVAATASTLAQQLVARDEKIAALERVQYENRGRADIVNPAQERMALAIEALTQAQASGSGKSAGFSSAWAILIAVVGLLATIGPVVAIVLTRK